MKKVVELKNWKFHLGDIKLWDKVDHSECYMGSKVGYALGKRKDYLLKNTWQDITVPHDFCIHGIATPEGMASNGYKPRGIGWYHTVFDLPDDCNGDVYLEFEGIGSSSVVYVNDALVARNYSSYTGFIIDITGYLLPGENTVTVRADNLRWEGWWYEGAGIYRPARIYLMDESYYMPMETHITESRNGEKWSVDVKTDIRGRKVCTQKVRLFDNAVQLCEGTDHMEIISPKLWSPEDPKLYTVEISLLCDGVEFDKELHKIGFRTVSWQDDGMYLNGSRYFVRGVCAHQDHAGVGIAVPEALLRYRLGKLKAMGANAYRCAHHNVSNEFLDICDELGILVMNENRNFGASEEILSEIRYLVKNSRNHPSVFVYSLLNEEPWQKDIRGKRIAEKLKCAILELDKERAITGAINGAEAIKGESAADVLDVMGMNYSIFAYDKLYETQKKAILATENGPVYATRGVYNSDSNSQIYGSYADELTSFGQSYEDTIRAIKAGDHIAGVFFWSLFDYHGEPQPFEWPSVLSHWGMCDACGFEKDTYYYVKSLYSDEPMVHLLPQWQGYSDGEEVRVAVFTNCRLVKLYLNGTQIGEGNVVDNRVEFVVPYEKGVLKAVGINDGIEVTDTVSSAGAMKQLCCEVFGTDSGYRIVNVSAIDSEGIFVNGADATVRVSVNGGKIIGSGNGDPNAPLECDADNVPMFHGRCQFIVEKRSEDEFCIVVEANGTEAVVLR